MMSTMAATAADTAAGLASKSPPPPTSSSIIPATTMGKISNAPSAEVPILLPTQNTSNITTPPVTTTSSSTRGVLAMETHNSSGNDYSEGEASFSKDTPENNAHSSTEEPAQSIRPPLSGSKRTLMTHSKDGKLLSEKKLRRLEKNRLSARECRRRKREATENLERQINVLEGENLRLRLQLQIGKEAEDSRLREQERLTQDIDELLKSGAPESDIYQQLEEFKEKHADYGKSRRSAIEFHLRQIERLLMPTQTTSLVLQAMQGGEPETPVAALKPSAGISMASTAGTNRLGVVPASASTFPPDPMALVRTPSNDSTGSAVNPNTKMNPKALFQYLVNYLEVTPEQAVVLKDSRFVASELDGCLDAALRVLGELRLRLAQTGDDLETEFSNVRSILTPTQAAKFLVWVANNCACMHMLNELWDRVYGNVDAHETHIQTRPSSTVSPR